MATETARKLNLDLNYDCTPSIALGGFLGRLRVLLLARLVAVASFPSNAGRLVQLPERSLSAWHR